MDNENSSEDYLNPEGFQSITFDINLLELNANLINNNKLIKDNLKIENNEIMDIINNQINTQQLINKYLINKKINKLDPMEIFENNLNFWSKNIVNINF
ncbi:hypothetical protein Mgra_00007165 [Meloidogyne graminicola]|uniref:Uncharacterized protein n=1 Tax=Meloidogyne graminicola TaxID=189291 RepID=A0A8S9ZJE4_9BILA|nr:hypothetical protein Mgra_00007165 [Meloidogyne graminicola]